MDRAGLATLLGWWPIRAEHKGSWAGNPISPIWTPSSPMRGSGNYLGTGAKNSHFVLFFVSI
jgi:hypothetical protein